MAASNGPAARVPGRALTAETQRTDVASRSEHFSICVLERSRRAPPSTQYGHPVGSYDCQVGLYREVMVIAIGHPSQQQKGSGVLWALRPGSTTRFRLRNIARFRKPVDWPENADGPNRRSRAG